MTGLFDPDTPWEAVLLAFISLCGLLGVVLPGWISQHRQGKQIVEIKDQVSNTHEENLRDEITRGFREIRADIGGLREEIRTERTERIAGDRVRDTNTFLYKAASGD